MTQPTIEELREVLIAEARYWNESEDGTEYDTETMRAASIIAVGALSNIMAATFGHRAPWHPRKPKKQPNAETGKDGTTCPT